MKANELRVGNLIEWNKQPFEVCVIYDNAIENELWCKPINELHPIPLTEEWLAKFGFKKCLDTIYVHWTSQTGIFEISTRLPSGSYGVWTGSGTMGCFECVHQLQNVFFALTGEELILKKD